MPDPSPQELTSRITGFLRDIGLPVTFGPIQEPTFLPGLTIRYGSIVADLSKLTHPGDLLHEAGHLALLAPEERMNVTAPIDPDGGMEVGAMAWSWAALVHLGLDPEVVFHPDGYKGESQAIIGNFSQGRTFGVPILQWLGLITTKAYPTMNRWLRETAGGPGTGLIPQLP